MVNRDLGVRESEILEIIRSNPYISQQEIADQVGLSRSSVANIISGLIQRHYLLGRAYVLNGETPIVCIGGMNVDRKFYSTEKLVMNTSNPVQASSSVGGVCRNIAENLGRMEQDIVMLSLAGEDSEWELIKEVSKPYMSLKYVEQTKKYPTSSYTAILDVDGQMQLALANMDICDAMTIAWLQRHQTLVSRAKAVIADLNAPLETTEYLIQLCREKEVPLAIIPVSSPKMNRLPKSLVGVEWLIVNQDESEAYFGVQVQTDEEFYQLADNWLAVGVKNVVLTRGGESVYYAGDDGSRLEIHPKKQEQYVDATGAGDSFAAGVLFGWLNNYDVKDVLQFGLTNAYYTIQSLDTVRKNLTKNQLIIEKESLYHE